MTHFLATVFGVVLLFIILRSMIRIALMNCHSQDFFAKYTGRAERIVRDGKEAAR